MEGIHYLASSPRLPQRRDLNVPHLACRSRDRRVTYLPAVLILFGAVGCITIVAFDIMFATRFADPSFFTQYNDLTVSVLANDIALTWYYTGMICYCLWLLAKQKRAVEEAANGNFAAWSNITSRHGKVMWVLIQSGILYSVTELAFLVCILLDIYNGEDIINYLNVRIIGFTTTLIILQLNTGGAEVNASLERSRRRAAQPAAGSVGTGFSIPVFNVAGTIDSKDPESVAYPSMMDANGTDVNQISHNNSLPTSTDAKSQSPSASGHAGEHSV
ncbi:hypothetical protein FRB93_004831 [Tulasnella sp. JGI-2019a]|nr:hypothetical protein FRB93_004831 [Tulasnella sp. JGI-2019a]